MDDMLKDFVVEAMDLAVNVEEHLLRLERDPDNKETLNAVFRSFHTIKGGAGFMGLPAMVAACHLTENLFDALRTGQAPVTPLAIEAALEASGFVADQLNDLNNGTPPEGLAQMPEGLERILTDAIEGKSAAPAPKPAAAPVAAAAPAAAALAPATHQPLLRRLPPRQRATPLLPLLLPYGQRAGTVSTAAAMPRWPMRVPPRLPPRTKASVSMRSNWMRCWKWRANRCRPPTRPPCCSSACSSSSSKARPPP